jgi:hypothetical protein
VDCAEEVSRELIVACRYRTKLLEFSEETLDQVAFFVENEIAFPFVFAIAPWRNDDGDSRVAQPFDQGVCIVTFVAEQRAASDAFEQLPRGANIVDVAGRQNKPDRIAQGVGERMDFACQTAPGASDGLVLAPFFRAPALC